MNIIDFEDNSMDIDSSKGTKIKFTAEGGGDGEIESAKKILKLNAIYTVKCIEIGDWYSAVVLEEFPNLDFNTALFEKV
jgi:hypothetical protein